MAGIHPSQFPIFLLMVRMLLIRVVVVVVVDGLRVLLGHLIPTPEVVEEGVLI
jgi:hypothetical protein